MHFLRLLFFISGVLYPFAAAAQTVGATQPHSLQSDAFPAHDTYVRPFSSYRRTAVGGIKRHAVRPSDSASVRYKKMNPSFPTVNTASETTGDTKDIEAYLKNRPDLAPDVQ